MNAVSVSIYLVFVLTKYVTVAARTHSYKHRNSAKVLKPLTRLIGGNSKSQNDKIVSNFAECRARAAKGETNESVRSNEKTKMITSKNEKEKHFHYKYLIEI